MSAIVKLQNQPYPYLIQQAFSRLSSEEQVEVLKDADLSKEILFTLVSLSRGLKEDHCRLVAKHQNADEATLLLIVSFSGHNDDIMEDILSHQNVGAKTLLAVAKLGIHSLCEIIKSHPAVDEDILSFCEPAKLYIEVSQFSLPKQSELFTEFKERQTGSSGFRESKGPMKATLGRAVFRVNKDDTLSMTDHNWDSGG